MTQNKRRHQAMVLVWVPAAGTNYWCDFESDAKTLAALIERLRAGAERGEWLRWRIITIEQEEMGVCR